MTYVVTFNPRCHSRPWRIWLNGRFVTGFGTKDAAEAFLDAAQFHVPAQEANRQEWMRAIEREPNSAFCGDPQNS